MDHEQAFLKLLFALAKVTNFELEQEIVTIYDTRLGPLGYEKVNNALKDFIAEMPRQFPSVKAIHQKVVPELNQKDQSIFITDKLLEAIKRHGLNWNQGYFSSKGNYWHIGHDLKRVATFGEAVDFYLGPVGAAVIHSRGGWRMLAEEAMEADYGTTFRAQLRDTVISLMGRAEHGQLHDLPLLPGQKTTKRLDNLIKSSIKTIK